MTYWKPAAVIIAILSLLVFVAVTISPAPLTGNKPGSLKTFDSMEGGSKYVDLGEFLINPKDGYGGQYVKASISLKLDESEAAQTAEEKLPEIRHQVNMVIQNQTAAELSTFEGKQKLADAIREHAEQVMGVGKALAAEGSGAQPRKGRAISEVLFTSFIIH